MLSKIMRHDLRLLVADKTLWIIAALFVAFIGYGTFTGARFASARDSVVHDLRERGEQVLQTQKAEAVDFESGAKPMPSPAPDALLPRGKSYPVLLPGAPLAALSIGQSDIYPYSTNVDIMTEKNDLFNEHEHDNPLNLLAGRFDLAFVFVFLFPLLILALSYNILSAEKENGTLQLTMANSSLSLRHYVVGKVLARLSPLLIFALGFSLIGFALSGVDMTEKNTIFRLALWILAVLFYALFWFALAVLVNAFNFSSATNATILAGCWVTLVIVTPALLHVAAAALHPVPSRLEFVSKVREADNGTRSAGEKLLSQYYGDHPELVPAGQLDVADFTQRFYAIRQERQRRLLPEVNRFDEQLRAQQTLVGRYRVFSPAVVMQETLNDIAGTSIHRQHSFINQIRAFVDDWHGVLIPRLMRKENLRASDYDRMPRFRFQEETNATIARRSGFGFLLLFIPTILIGLFAFARLPRFSLIK